MEGVLEAQLISNKIYKVIALSNNFIGKELLKQHNQLPFWQSRSSQVASQRFPFVFHRVPDINRRARDAAKLCATRRRRANIQTDTYVFMEPGKSEEFVSEEELRIRLKGWLENWPGKALPPDIARFESIDDAVQFLVKSVCELEIDGEVGSIQWYEIRLE